MTARSLAAVRRSAARAIRLAVRARAGLLARQRRRSGLARVLGGHPARIVEAGCSNPETCPVRALRDWLEVSGITQGAVFRSVDRHDRLSCRRLTAQSVAKVVERHADAAGQDAAGFAAHSLRSGFATEAFAQGVPEFTV